MTRTVAILGLGERGRSWAQAFYEAGWKVRGFDPDPDAHLPIARADWRRDGTISGTVESADWIAVCLPERLELLQKVIQRAQAEASPDAVFAVDSKTFTIDDVQSCAMRPASVILSQVDTEGGFTVDVSRKTSQEARATAETTLAQLAAHHSLSLPNSNPPAQDAESA